MEVVTVVQRRLTHYRVPLFNELRRSLRSQGILLRLLHGTPASHELSKSDSGSLEWAESLPTTYFAGERLCWQPFAARAEGSSLVIVTHENGLLANHLALLRRPAPKLAFWGHGANFQGRDRSLRERYKRWSANRADWYFAYTELSVDLVTSSGFPASRVTQLDNAIDLAGLSREIASVEASDLPFFRTRFGLEDGPIGLFIGSLYAHKRLDFLIATAQRLRQEIPNFQLLVIGDGPERERVEVEAAKHSWIRPLGARVGRDKAAALRLSSIIMNPGLVGLGILDGFAAGVPMVTTDCGLHSPEIAYLDPNNGVMTPDDLKSYTAACQHLLTDEAERERLKAGCSLASEKYTLSNMVANFSQGIINALESST